MLAPQLARAGRCGEEITTVDKYKVLEILLSVFGSGLMRVELETNRREVSQSLLRRPILGSSTD